MKVMVIGGTGTIGREVVKRLVRRHEVLTSGQVVLGGGMEVIDTEAERISQEILWLVHGNAGTSPSQ